VGHKVPYFAIVLRLVGFPICFNPAGIHNQNYWHKLTHNGNENQLVIYTFIFPGGRIFASQKWGGATLKSLANVVHKIKLLNSLLHQQNQGEQTGRGSRPHEDQYQRGQIRYQPQKNGQSR
jgi:hypothetical protein